MTGRNTYYIHYSYLNFKRLVDSGEKTWEAVAAADDSLKKQRILIPRPEVEPELDEYGFPKISPNEFQGRKNSATLSDCIQSYTSRPLVARYRKPINRGKPESAGVEVHQEPDEEHSENDHIQGLGQVRENNIFDKLERRYKPRPKWAPSRVLKEKIDLPANFFSMSNSDREYSRHKQLAGIKYAAGKALNQIAVLVQSGVDPVAAEEEIYSKMDTQHVQSGLKPPSPAMRAYLAGEYGEWRTRLEEEAKLAHRAQTSTRKGIPAMKPYLPSIAAHTQPFYSSGKRGSVRIGRQSKNPRKPRTSTLAPNPPVSNNITFSSATPASTALIDFEITKSIKRKGRLRKSNGFLEPVPYLPSIVAHTRPNLDTSASQKRTRSAPKTKWVPVTVRYLPSTAAHSRPYLDPAQFGGAMLAKRKRGAPKGKRALKTAAYLPSIAAHTRPYLDPAQPTKRRQRKTQLPGHLADSLVFPDTTTAIPEVITAKRKREPTSFEPRKRPATRNTRLAFYNNLAESVLRPLAAGFAFSQSERNPSRRGKPWSMLAIFKSDRLKNFSWFHANEPLRKPNAPLTPEQLRAQAMRTYNTVQPRKMSSWTTEHQNSPSPARIVHSSRAASPSSVVLELPHDSRFDAFKALADGTLPLSDTRATVFQPQLSPNTVNRGLPDVSADLNVSKSRNCTTAGNGENQGSALVNLGGQELIGSSFEPVLQLQNGRSYAGTTTTGHTVEAELESLPNQSAAIDQRLEQHPRNRSDLNIEKLRSEARSTASSDSIIQPDDHGLETVGNANGMASPEIGDAPQPRTPESVCVSQEDQANGRSKSVDATISGNQGAEPNEGSNSESLPKLELGELHTSVGPRKKFWKAPRLGPQGGSMAILRKNIVLEILEKCGGILPGDRALDIAFADRWHKHGHSGLPNRPTIRAATDSLTRTGEIHRLTFSFRNKTGQVLIKSIFITANIDNHDPRIKDVQKRIIDAEPRSYVPAELGLENGYHPPSLDKVRGNIPKDSSVIPNIQHKPIYLVRLEKRRQQALERARKILHGDDPDTVRSEERQEFQKEKKNEIEQQRVRRELAEIRYKYPADRQMTLVEQQELMTKYRSSYQEMLSLELPNERAVDLPALSSFIDGQTFKAFSEACLLPPGRITADGGVVRHDHYRWKYGEVPSRPQAKIRKVERLASLKTGLPKPRIGNIRIRSKPAPSDVLGSVSVALPDKAVNSRGFVTERTFTARRKQLRKAVPTQEQSGEIVANPTQPREIVVKQPPWEVLQLQSINPSNLPIFGAQIISLYLPATLPCRRSSLTTWKSSAGGSNITWTTTLLLTVHHSSIILSCTNTG